MFPRSFRKVRYYGLYAPGNAKHRLEVARELLVGADDEHEQQLDDETDLERGDRTPRKAKVVRWRCHACNSHRTYRVFVLARGVVRIARAPP